MRHIYASIDGVLDLLCILRKGKKIPTWADLDKLHADLKNSKQILQRVDKCFDQHFSPDDELTL